MLHNNDIVINDEFRGLLPPLSGEVYEELEKSILAEGCRDAIVLWNGVIVDGHNRYAICQKHSLPFKIMEKDFGSSEEAKIWIILTQFARRQLSAEEVGYYRGMQYNLEKKLIPNGEGKNQHSAAEVEAQNGTQPSTAQRIAEQYNVSKNTIKRDGQVTSAIDKIGEASPDAKKKILAGKSNITKKELGKLHKASDEEISAVAEQIADGTYATKRKPAKQTSAANTETPVSAEQTEDSRVEEQPADALGDKPPEDDANEEEQPDETEREPESEPIKNIHVPEGWDMPVTVPGKKQTWCAYVSAGIEALGGVIGNIEKDLRNKLPLIETKAERDFLREIFQSYIDRQIEIIKQI